MISVSVSRLSSYRCDRRCRFDLRPSFANKLKTPRSDTIMRWRCFISVSIIHSISRNWFNRMWPKGAQFVSLPEYFYLLMLKKSTIPDLRWFTYDRLELIDYLTLSMLKQWSAPYLHNSKLQLHFIIYCMPNLSWRMGAFEGKFRFTPSIMDLSSKWRSIDSVLDIRLIGASGFNNFFPFTYSICLLRE